MNNFQITAFDTDSLFFKKPSGQPFSPEEIIALQKSLNSLYPERIYWELNDYFPAIVTAAAKNYFIKHQDGSIKFKGSALKDPKKEQGLREFIQQTMILLSEDRQDEIPAFYNKYAQEICSLKDIKRYCSKKTITSSVLNPERTNEQKILDALSNEESLQEGDKIHVYFKADRSLSLEKNFDGDYDKMGLLSKLYKTAIIISDIYPVKEKLPNYALKRNLKVLEALINDSEWLSHTSPSKTKTNPV